MALKFFPLNSFVNCFLLYCEHWTLSILVSDSSLGIQIAQNIGRSNEDKGLSDSSKGIYL